MQQAHAEVSSAGVNRLSRPQRFVRAVGESPAAERVADAQAAFYKPVIDWARRGPLHTNVLGYSIHPVLTHLTLGCWVSASILDVAGGAQAQRSAGLLTGAGVVGGLVAGFAGAADWADLTGAERRVGAIHSLGTDVSMFLMIGSLLARGRGRHGIGMGLGLAGNAAAAGAGFLGGHLAFRQGVALREATVS